MAEKNEIIGVDLFAGAGGMSLGAKMAGIDVVLAVEKDSHAAATYSHNHPETKLIVDDIANLEKVPITKKGKTTVLFGGPPCQGFSTSNQRTRNNATDGSQPLAEFLRLVSSWRPDWVVFENVKGIVETEQGYFKDMVLDGLKHSGYRTTAGILCAADFGVPQFRSRFFVIGSRHGLEIDMPKRTCRKYVTVRQAISDLPSLTNGACENFLPYPRKARSRYAQTMRNGAAGCRNHLVTRNANYVLQRYATIPKGGNWEDIPMRLLNNYTDPSRCHTGIYHRLRDDIPSVVIGNYRKNMLIHPQEDRGLSVREAARIQSFPDKYEFMGSIGFQQQQVGNAVPPLLAKELFTSIMQGC